MCFNLIYRTATCGKYIFGDSIFEKYGTIWKNCCFSRRLWLDWGNTTRAPKAALGSKGIISV